MFNGKIEVHVPNDAGVFGARRGIWRGKESVFTHRNPKNGKIWGENLPDHWGSLILGTWVDPKEVKFI